VSLSRLQLMRSRRLTNKRHPALKPYPMRSLLRIRQLQPMRSLPRILRKKRPKPKSALGSSKLTATYIVSVFSRCKKVD